MTTYMRDHLHQPPDPATIADIHARKTQIYGDLIASGTADLRPGIADLIADARANGIRLAVATTTNRPNVDHLTQTCFGRAADQVFEVITAGDEVAHKKPAPDVFNLALTGLDLDPADCVGLEDSRNGLLSCTGARIPCIVSPGIYTRGADFTGAAAVIDCFSQIDSIAKLTALLEA